MTRSGEVGLAAKVAEPHNLVLPCYLAHTIDGACWGSSLGG